MKIGLDVDEGVVFVMIEGTQHALKSTFDVIGARAVADQLIKSVEALETLQEERMKENL